MRRDEQTTEQRVPAIAEDEAVDEANEEGPESIDEQRNMYLRTIDSTRSRSSSLSEMHIWDSGDSHSSLGTGL